MFRHQNPRPRSSNHLVAQRKVDARRRIGVAVHLALAAWLALLCTSSSRATWPPPGNTMKTDLEGPGRRAYQERFQSLEDAVARAEEILNAEKFRDDAALVYSINTRDGGRVRVNTDLCFGRCGDGGHIPGRASTGESVVRPVLLFREARALELQIRAPGYDVFSRRLIIHAGELVVWDDVMLEPLTRQSASEVTGRVWLEGNADLEGLVIKVDNVPVAFTDADGYFSTDRIHAGKLLIESYIPGFVGAYKRIKVDRGGTANVKLRGYRERFARVRWAYQPDGTRNLGGNTTEGIATLSSRVLSRVSFGDGFVHVHEYSDFLVEQKRDRLTIRHFDVRGTDIPASTVVKDIDFDDVLEAPEKMYQRPAGFQLRPGVVYVFRCYDGKHFAKMEVLEITDERPSERR